MHPSAFTKMMAIVWSMVLVALGNARGASFTGGGAGLPDPNVPGPRSGSVLEIAVVRDGAVELSGYLGMTLYTLTGNEPCDTYVLCETPDPENFLCSTRRAQATESTSANAIAGLLASELTGVCPSGTSASAVGNVLTVKSNARGVRACVFSGEMGVVDEHALGLNVGAFAVDCAAHNVDDGTVGNERSTVARTAGFAFMRPAPIPQPTPVSVPALPGAWRWLLVAMVAGAGLRRVVWTGRAESRRSS